MSPKIGTLFPIFREDVPSSSEDEHEIWADGPAGIWPGAGAAAEKERMDEKERTDEEAEGQRTAFFFDFQSRLAYFRLRLMTLNSQKSKDQISEK